MKAQVKRALNMVSKDILQSKLSVVTVQCLNIADHVMYHHYQKHLKLSLAGPVEEGQLAHVAQDQREGVLADLTDGQSEGVLANLTDGQREGVLANLTDG